jgi:hypothetical protein
MLEKYCIKTPWNKNSLWALPINAERITKNDIRRVSGQIDPKTDRSLHEPFFEFTGQNINKF